MKEIHWCEEFKIFDVFANEICKSLPEYYQIIISLEEGCGTVELIDSEGNNIRPDDEIEYTLTEQMFELLNKAMDQS